MFGDPILFLIGALFLVPAVLVAIPAHELGHGFAALFMGDPTPRNRGFLRLQPRLYFNPYGLLAAFLANVAWGEPVPVNEYRLASVGRKLVYALGGPAANLAVAVVTGLALRALGAMGAFPSLGSLAQPPLGLLTTAIYAIYFLNLATFAFQLLPIPGLDGWRVLEALLRNRNPRFFFDAWANRQTIWVVCALVVFFGPVLLRFSVLGAVVGIFFEPAAAIILGRCTVYVSLQPCPL